MCKDIGDYRPLNGSGTLNDQQLLWLYVMRSAEQIKEEHYNCDSCRSNKALGIRKPHNCPSCGKPVNNFNDPEREEKLKVFIEQQRIRKLAAERKREEERKRIEAELEAKLMGEEEEHDESGGQEG